MGKSNWKENYSLEEFYRNQTENLFLGNYEQEQLTIGGQNATWFKDVRSRRQEDPEILVDVIAMDLDDRIIEMEIHEKEFWTEISTIVNSIKFYPGKVIADLGE